MTKPTRNYPSYGTVGALPNHNAQGTLSESNIKFGYFESLSRASKNVMFAESGGGVGSGSLPSMSDHASATIS